MTAPAREIGWTLAAGAGVAAACALLLAQDSGFFWRDDYQIGGVPILYELHRALAHGEWPMLTPLSWVLPSLAGEYASGVFSPVVLLGAFAAVSLHGSMALTGAVYAIYLLLLTAMGAFRLGRVEGLTVPLALMVALVAALNGWSLVWGATNWICAGAGFAALTWAWWGLARLVRHPGNAAPLGIAAGALALLLLAGWPHTVIMTGLLSLWLWARARLAPAPGLAIAAAWALGAGLSAPAWLNFLEFLPHTFRAGGSGGLQWEWLVPLSALPGLFLPTLVVPWNTFGQAMPHVPVELINGLVPVGCVLLLAARGAWRRALGWELALVGALFALACLPSLGMFRWSFRWLPLAHLALALLAGHIWQRHEAHRLRETPFEWSHNPGVLAGIGILLTHVLARVIPVLETSLAGVYGAAAALWAGADEWARRHGRSTQWLAPALTLGVLLTSYTLLPTRLAVPTWKMPDSLMQVAPLRPDVRYFVIASPADYFPGGFAGPGFGPHLRPGLSQFLSGIEVINGYSAMAPKGPAAAFPQGVHGYLDAGVIPRVLAHDSRPGGLLDRLGVHGLMLAASQRGSAPVLLRQGWRVTSEGPDGLVLHREGPDPRAPRCVTRVRFAPLEGGAAWWAALTAADGVPAVPATSAEPTGTLKHYGARPLQRREASRNQVEIEVARGETPVLIATMRAWVPGWQAELNGQPLPIYALDGLNTAIEVPPGAGGVVILRYRPWGLRWGLWCLGTSAVLWGCWAWFRRRRAAKA